MNLLRIGLACLLVLGVTVARADEKKDKDLDKDKLVGTWEVTKGDSLPVGSTVEFTKDGKSKFVILNSDGKTQKFEGTYKIEGQGFKSVVKIEDKEHTETIKVTTLTDKELVVVDEKGQKDTFKKK